MLELWDGLGVNDNNNNNNTSCLQRTTKRCLDPFFLFFFVMVEGWLGGWRGNGEAAVSCGRLINERQSRDEIAYRVWAGGCLEWERGWAANHMVGATPEDWDLAVDAPAPYLGSPRP